MSRSAMMDAQVVRLFVWSKSKQKSISISLEQMRSPAFWALAPCDFGFIFMGHVLVAYLMLDALIYLLFLIAYPLSLFFILFFSLIHACFL